MRRVVKTPYKDASFNPFENVEIWQARGYICTTLRNMISQGSFTLRVLPELTDLIFRYSWAGELITAFNHYRDEFLFLFFNDAEILEDDS